MRFFRDGLSTFTQWFGWTLSFIASVFFMYFVIGEGIPDLLKGNNLNELKFFLPLLLLAVTGCIFSFFRKKTGAVLMLLGGAGLVAFFYYTSGLKDFGMMVVYGLPYILPGFLLLVVKD